MRLLFLYSLALSVGIANAQFYEEDFESFDAGARGFWWSSSPSGSSAWYRYLDLNYENVVRNNYDSQEGYSVRCVRDSE